MSIEIEAQVFLKHGYPYVKITSIKNMFHKDELPKQYLKKYGCAYRIDYSVFGDCTKHVMIETFLHGCVQYEYMVNGKPVPMTEKEFKNLVKRIKKAGKVLAKVNKKARKKASNREYLHKTNLPKGEVIGFPFTIKI